MQFSGRALSSHCIGQHYATACQLLQGKLACTRSYQRQTKFTPVAVPMQLACEHFNANGYAVLPRFLDNEELKLLRQV